MTVLELTPSAQVPPRSRAVLAQTAMETKLILRNGEQLLLTIAIPVALLVLFAKAPIAHIPKPRIEFMAPGVFGLAVMSTAFTGQAIGTGFERRYGVLRRLSTTPLSRAGLLAAKTSAVLLVEVLQAVMLCIVAAVLGWHPHGSAAAAIGLVLLGTACFSALALLMAGTLRAEATLAGANLFYLVSLGLGGVAYPLSDYSHGVQDALGLLPLTALSGGLRAVLDHGSAVPLHDWLTLLVWAAIGVTAAVRWFRWD
ncbi:MAG TPA: ABC transporter permease [Mycobacteriales bacterium]|nr:ABC transporter permease [Mycobacteriales bacterium]